MKYFYRDAEIFYKFVNKQSDTTNIYLHGWGCSCKSFDFCQQYITKNNSLFIDFPPFGKSSKNIKNWNVFTYANMVISLCQHLKIKKFNIIGHSFGGRIAIIMAVLCKEEANKIVLVDSAGLKPRRSLNYYFKVYSYKLKKKFGLDVSKYGSCDYLALDTEMKKIFKSIINTHLDDFLPFINAETLIIFGEKDSTTPIYMAKKMKRKIKKSQIVILKEAGHFCFLDRKIEFLNYVKKFLED